MRGEQVERPIVVYDEAHRLLSDRDRSVWAPDAEIDRIEDLNGDVIVCSATAVDRTVDGHAAPQTAHAVEALDDVSAAREHLEIENFAGDVHGFFAMMDSTKV